MSQRQHQRRKLHLRLKPGPRPARLLLEKAEDNSKDIKDLVNARRQISDSGEIEKIVAYVSKYITLRKGDFIFTGTPKGVSRIEAGDKLEAFIEEEKLLTVNVK